MNIKSLIYFLALCRYKNYSKVAEILDISRVGLVKRIKNFEIEMGSSLINKNAKQFELTESGKHVYEQFNGFLYEFFNIKAEIKNECNDEVSIGITCSESASTFFDMEVAEIIHLFDLKESIYYSSPEEMFEQILQRKIEFGFFYCNEDSVTPPSSIVLIKLREESIGLYADKLLDLSKPYDIYIPNYCGLNQSDIEECLRALNLEKGNIKIQKSDIASYYAFIQSRQIILGCSERLFSSYKFKMLRHNIGVLKTFSLYTVYHEKSEHIHKLRAKYL